MVLTTRANTSLVALPNTLCKFFAVKWETNGYMPLRHITGVKGC